MGIAGIMTLGFVRLWNHTLNMEKKQMNITKWRKLIVGLVGGGLLISEINGVPAADHPLAPFLADSGFSPSAMGFQMRKSPSAVGSLAVAERAPLPFTSARSMGRVPQMNTE